MPLNMHRIAFRTVSSNVLNRKCCNGSSRLFKTVRYYSKSEKPNLCPPKKPKPGSYGAIYTIGAITLIGGTAVTVAKYDPDFREWLDGKIPYSDEFIKFILQEDKTYLQSCVALLDAIKASFLGIFFGDKVKRSQDIPIEPKDYNPPPPAFTSLAKEKDKEELYAEIRLDEKKDGKGESKVTITGDQKPEESLPDIHPKSILELETRIGESASAAVQAYNKAVFALKNYNHDVAIVIEDSVERLDPAIWNSLREKTKAKEQTLKEAQSQSNQTKAYIQKLKELMRDPSFDAPDAVRQQAQLNVDRVTEDIETARKELEKEQTRSNITDKYWKKVEEARAHFIDEIEILFPGVNINERKLELEGPELDLFILHAFSNVLYYQKELYKLQTLEDQKVKAALEAARRGNKDILTDAQIHQLVEKEKRDLDAEHVRRCLCLRVESEKELRRQLKLQSEAFSDHLSDALKAKEMEMQRDFARKVDEKVTEERCKFKLQLSALAGRVRGMDEALKARAESDKTARQAQVLWSACQALFRALKVGCPGLPWTEQLRPLEPEITAVKQAAAKGDELVEAVVAGIPKEAKERGVYPEDALRERFLKVEKVCRQLTLVPEGGARLPLHILSYLQSLLLLKAASPIPQAELDDEAVDFSSLGTNDILQRARYWMDRGDFAQTLRYMNLLEGGPRCAAFQWMNEARILLETEQAANTLMAHAAASGLMYL